MIEENGSMKSFRAQIFAGLVLATASTSMFAQTQPAPQLSAGNVVPVTVDNFIRAEVRSVCEQHGQGRSVRKASSPP